MGEYADLEVALRVCTKFLLGPRELRLQSGESGRTCAAGKDSLNARRTDAYSDPDDVSSVRVPTDSGVRDPCTGNNKPFFC